MTPRQWTYLPMCKCVRTRVCRDWKGRYVVQTMDVHDPRRVWHTTRTWSNPGV